MIDIIIEYIQELYPDRYNIVISKKTFDIVIEYRYLITFTTSHGASVKAGGTGFLLKEEFDKFLMNKRDTKIGKIIE